MSARKRKSRSELEESYEEIQNILIDVKPKLHDSQRIAWPSALTGLYKIAALAETFSQHRPRSNEGWAHLADKLDREGVNLWNLSGLIREASDIENRTVFAAIRVAAFRLIEAGLEQRPGIETLIHVLQLASKAGASLSESGSKDKAASILACAAKYEEALRNADDPQGLHLQAQSRAIVIYYSSRMEAAWREGNDSVADFMLQKITENDKRLSELPSCDREAFAAKLLEIGKSLLRERPRDADPSANGGKAPEAIKWMQKSFSILERLEDGGATELKRSVLRSLARAYFLSSAQDPDNLTRAEASLHELITSIDSGADHTNSEYQQLRWMRVAVLKRRNAPSAELLDAFRSIIDHMAYTESNVTDILQELRTLAPDHVLVTHIHQYALHRALCIQDNAGLPYVDRLLLSLIFHCSKDERHARGVRDAETAFDCICDAEYELPHVPATACLTLLWQFGDRQYRARQWDDGADWFLAGTHKVFSNMIHISHAKCFRKAALCYIQKKEYSRASAVIRRCPGDEATTHYVVLLTAIHQGLEDEAIRAVKDMTNAPGFDRKMLLLATQLASDSEMKMLLLSVLEELLSTMERRVVNIETDMEAMTLIRCIIRLVLKIMGDPGPCSIILVPALIKHFVAAKALVDSFRVRQSLTVAAKDISWLWRTAYNTAVQGCLEWPNSEEHVSEMFEIARQLLEAHRDSAMSDVNTEVYNCIVNASFATVAGRVFAIRQIVANTDCDQSAKLQYISREIILSKERIQRVLDEDKLKNSEDISRAQSCLHVLRVFETEILCQMKDWNQLLHVIEEFIRADALSVNTFEAVADILWVEKECPVEVLFIALEAILHACLDRSALSVSKFSRWLRAICTILLSRNTSADRIKAIGYVEQAINVLEEHSEAKEDGNEAYPQDERQWLLGTVYNTGVECLHASLLDEAKRWFESSTTICRFVPDGDIRTEKISETYTYLLARYARRPA